MLSTAVRRLINLYAVKPGERAVVLSANTDGDAAVADLKRAGVEVARVEDARLGGDVAAVRGRARVRAVELGDGTTIGCDLLVTAVGWTAPTALLNACGDRPAYLPRAARFFPDAARLPEDVLVTGGIAGDGRLDELTEHGSATGAEAARRAARIARARMLAAPTRALPGDDPAGSRTRPHPRAAGLPAPGAVRRPHSRVSSTSARTYRPRTSRPPSLRDMPAPSWPSGSRQRPWGRWQGKLETVNTVAVVARATGSSIAETGTTTWRPPYAPVTLGALAGQAFEPVRYSPMQPWHEAHGAVPLIAGAWDPPRRLRRPGGGRRVTCART